MFELTPPAQQGGTWTETVLYNFCSASECTDGGLPEAGLIEDAAGNLYGTTAGGGANNYGTVFELAPPAKSGGAWTETVLYSFCSATNCTDGWNPEAGLILDAAGNLYGATVEGGANTSFNDGYGAGTVFELTPPAQQGGTWKETVLYSFCSASDCTDGVWPEAGLIQDAAGNLYGTTFEGGADEYGTVFKLVPPAQQGGAWTETVLYSFGSVANDGLDSSAGLIQDSAGNLYSTTSLNPGGTVFELTPPAQRGDTWTETVLYKFCSASDCIDGEDPMAGLIQDAAGNLYGTTDFGGTEGGGTVFKLTALPTPTVTTTPSASSITTAQSLTVTVAVSGGSGSPTPTGNVTLTSGSYNSGATTLSSGGVTINIPAGSLATGSDLLTATYSGDSNYSPATGTASVTVTTAESPSFTVSGTAVSVSPGATTGNTSMITVTPVGGFIGSVTLTAAITSSPASAQDLPTLSFGATSPVSITGASAGTATLTISTTAATSAALAHPARPGVGWYVGGTTLAFGLIFGIGGIGIGTPGRRRSWQTRIGALVFLVILIGGLLACGSSGSGNHGTGNPGTTPGTYTVTVTGTSGSTTATGTVTLTVQ